MNFSSFVQRLFQIESSRVDRWSIFEGEWKTNNKVVALTIDESDHLMYFNSKIASTSVFDGLYRCPSAWDKRDDDDEFFWCGFLKWFNDIIQHLKCEVNIPNARCKISVFCWPTVGHLIPSSWRTKKSLVMHHPFVCFNSLKMIMITHRNNSQWKHRIDYIELKWLNVNDIHIRRWNLSTPTIS